jgi:DNA-binding response OmpR family regulator
LAKWIKTLRPETRVLFMTGYAADILEQIQSTDAGAALIQKPFQLEELAQRLREIFDGKDEARPRAG